MSKLEISPEILEALQKLSALLEAEDAFEKTLNTVVELSVASLPGCDSAGITLRVEGKDVTAAASDEYALEIDKIQYESDQGPCVTALEKGKRQQIKAVSEETRWPEFCRRARNEGFGSSASYPLRIDGSMGALNLYARSERAFDDISVGLGEIFASQASIALQNARTYTAARSLADHLNEALKTRDTIGQAKGILMERENITDDEAFAMLRTISQQANVKLRDVAVKLIAETNREKPPPSTD